MSERKVIVAKSKNKPSMDDTSFDDMSMGGSSQPMGPDPMAGGADPMGAADPTMAGGADPTMTGGAEPMAADPTMAGGAGMGPDPSMGGDPNMGQDKNYGNDFDAGVEANEEEDPEKYIQQLTGKLSQSYNKYNSSQPKPNVDLAKYVAGMILKQTTKGLEPEDKKEIMDKVADGDDLNSQENSENTQQQPQDDMAMGDQSSMGMEQDPTAQPPHQGFGESRYRSRSIKINEILNDILNGNEEEDDIMQNVDNISFRKKPFTSPNFK